MTTTIHLPPDLARFVDEKLRSGDFPDADTLVNEALREKAQRDVAYQAWAEEHIAEALNDVRAGTAKYASLEVVSDWVQSWGSESEQPTPVCK